jgi:hypothetical protein
MGNGAPIYPQYLGGDSTDYDNALLEQSVVSLTLTLIDTPKSIKAPWFNADAWEENDAGGIGAKPLRL